MTIIAKVFVVGTGTDTGNFIRMAAVTSEVVGFLPTRGLISIAGIHPLNWLLDDTGPIARDVPDIAIALGVMAGEDAKDFRTKDSGSQAQSGPYTKYLNARALEGRRFAGATVVFDDTILPSSFMGLIGAINTQPYVGEGTETFLHDFGPPEYHSSAEYAQLIGSPLPAGVRGVSSGPQSAGAPRSLASDPMAEANFWQPQRLAVAAYDEALDRFKLDGFVYPAVQMPPNDELLPLLEGRRSNGPHSQTAWVNPIGVPAVSIPAGFYATGLPFGLELSTRRWKDGDLIGWAFAYEQATKYRKPPMLRDKR
jgi:Asp-tRNA(Asn)/Glu-tRNA(Gln) amidotransferase A subunit family amidase